MTKFEHILDLNSAYEANLLDQVLNDHDIPHAIIPTTDSAFGSIERMEIGYGYVSAPEEYREKITELCEDIRRKG